MSKLRLLNKLRQSQLTELWTPINIATSLWLDASDESTITESGGSVSQWNDKKGNGNNAVQTSGSAQPTTGGTINGLNAIDYNGSNHTLTVPYNSGFNGANLGVFIVAKAEALTASYGSPLTSRSSVARLGWNCYKSNNNIWQAWGHNGTFNDITGDAVVLNDVEILELSNNSGALSFWQNGVDKGSVSTLPNTNSALRIGCGENAGDNSFFFNGKIAEVVIMPTTPTTNERQTMEGYLAWKWGLISSLPSNHPYKNEPPTL